MKKIGSVVGSIIFGISITACSSHSLSATAELVDNQGKKIGTASFQQTGNGVEITVKAEGLPPGEHGFHIHETGKCEVPDFKSSGGHFNPNQKKHGKHNEQGTHAGDLENLTVNHEGKVTNTQVIPNVTLEKGKESSLLKAGGTALVIHEKADDYRTDPAGNAGKRIACGIIKQK
ncbi:superoxide dismutase family protein [Thermoflavimicrobium dichotomicum]|uniref:Superoxide dismutase [Cu-Zn] n=1 Tax=Thermoflavimicrobium dichotomicum TaxID=46223 RepID=A0A1I3U7K5_9BACL|nr:superoxide dismutase family protein [Thermoflavimicrobium dichotomicum]SFJ78990.1 superoxide dismutase, Cu-Zn family [Thermoflavimicrobium dichotomicum]